MKILYFEDDLIDQKSLKRLIDKNYPEIELHIASTEEEFNLIIEKMNFDLILADQFIDSVHVFNYLKRLTNQKIILVSGTESIFEQTNDIENLAGFLTKPIGIDDIEKYMIKGQSTIESLADGDQDFIAELKKSIKTEIQNEIAQYNEEDSNEAKANWIHKTKSKVALLEVYNLHSKATELERNLRNNINCDEELRTYFKNYQEVLKQL
ncbi:MAG: hypothetical protein ACK5MD_07325 [Flavobacteriales bacterium]